MSIQLFNIRIPIETGRWQKLQDKIESVQNAQ
jgi:hypothetical protein